MCRVLLLQLVLRRLTRCDSSAGTLKLQVLDVDLEILLLSFFIWILQNTTEHFTDTGLDSVWTCGPDCPSRPPVDLLEAWFIVSVSVLTGSRSFELKNVLQILNFCWEKLIKSVASPTKNTALVLFINNNYFHSVFLTKTSQGRTNMRGFTSYKTSVSQ